MKPHISAVMFLCVVICVASVAYPGETIERHNADIAAAHTWFWKQKPVPDSATFDRLKNWASDYPDDAESLFYLSLVGMRKINPQVDDAETLRLLKQSAALNYAPAEAYLASMELTGEGTARDVEDGKRLLHKAVDKGDLHATYNLGTFLKEGGKGITNYLSSAGGYLY
jgi:TPR repeat protein